MCDIIKLNVGGKYFETRRSTLEKSAFFSSLLSGRWETEKKNEEIFVDKYPEIFTHVLNFARFNHCEIEIRFDPPEKKGIFCVLGSSWNVLNLMGNTLCFVT